MAARKSTVLKLAKRRRALHRDTIANLKEMVDAGKSGEVTAIIAVASRPGYACWIVRSRMSSRDRLNMIGQLEYLKWLLIQDEDTA
jgi:hypothetical protein